MKQVQHADNDAGVMAGASAQPPEHHPGLPQLLQEEPGKVGLLSLDQKARIIWWDAGAESILGYTADEVAGKDISLIIPEEYIKLNKYRMRLAAGKGFITIQGRRTEIIARRKDGAELILECFPVMKKTGGRRLFRVAFSDITAQSVFGTDAAAASEGFARTSQDSTAAIRQITATAGRLLGGVCALCQTRNGSFLYTLAGWKAPKQLQHLQQQEGTVCYALIRMNRKAPLVLREPAQTEFARTDPAVRLQRFKALAGFPIRHRQKTIGALTVFFKDHKNLSQAELQLGTVLAKILEDYLRIGRQFSGVLQKQDVLRDYVRRLARGMFDIVAQEKKLLASTLHDELGAMAVGLDAHLTLVEDELEQGTAGGIRDELLQMRATLDRAVCNLKQIAVDLQPQAMETIDLQQTLRQYCTDIQCRTGITVFFKCAVDCKRLPGALSLALYRIVQEGLTNIAKHAQARNASVVLTADANGIRLHIIDDGRGFDTAWFFDSRSPRHLGLQGMRERIQSLDGVCALNTAPGRGTEISIYLPLQGRRHNGNKGNSCRRPYRRTRRTQGCYRTKRP